MKHKYLLFSILVLFSAGLKGQSFFCSLTGDIPPLRDSRQVALGFSSWGTQGSAAALSFNPALLSLHEVRLAVYAGLNGVSDVEKRSFPVQDSFGDFLADNSYVVNKNWFPGFHLGANYRLSPRINLAMTFRKEIIRDFRYEEEIRGSLYGQYNRDPLAGYYRITSTGNNTAISMGGSFQLFKSLRLGTAFQINLPGQYENIYEIDVIRESYNLASDHTISYQTNPDVKNGIDATVGLVFDMSKRLNFAMSYSLKGSTTIEKELIFLLNDVTSTLPVLAIDSTEKIKNAEFTKPTEFRIGLKYCPENLVRTSFFLEAVYQPWSDFKIDYKYNDDSFAPDFQTDLFASEFSLNDIWKIHLGIEYEFFSGVPFRLGFYHDPNPIDGGLDRNWFTAGTSYKWDHLSLDIAASFANSEYDYPDLFPVEGEERADFDTVREVYLLGILTLNYAF